MFYKCIGFRKLNKDLSILICYLKGEINIVSMYVNDFLLLSNIMITINALKQFLVSKYDTKNLGKVKTIIGWQINQDTILSIMNTYQSSFI